MNYNHSGLFKVHFFVRMIFYFFSFSFFYIIIIMALTINPKTKPPFTSGNPMIDGTLFYLLLQVHLFLLNIELEKIEEN